MTFLRRRLPFKLLLAAAAIAGVCAFLMCPRQGLTPSDLPGASEVSSGDIVLLSSETCRGMLVKLLDIGETFAHVGLLDVGDDVWLIHADPAANAVVRERLGEYVSSNVTAGIMILCVDSQAGETAVRFARDAARAHIAFDNDFKYGEGDGIYCTELVLRSWHEAGVELLPDVKPGDSVFPSQLQKSLRCHVKLVRRSNNG